MLKFSKLFRWTQQVRPGVGAHKNLQYLKPFHTSGKKLGHIEPRDAKTGRVYSRFFRGKPVRSFSIFAPANLPEDRVRLMLDHIGTGITDMLESNPGMTVERTSAEGNVDNLVVFISEEVGTYTFKTDSDGEELVMMSPSSG